MVSPGESKGEIELRAVAEPSKPKVASKRLERGRVAIIATVNNSPAHAITVGTTFDLTEVKAVAAKLDDEEN